MSERPKTLQHMQQLMAVAALAACKREGGAATADAEPSATPTTTLGAQPIDAGLVEASKDAEATDAPTLDAPQDAKKVVVVPVDIVHSTPRPHPTYHVVDMLPPPATVTPKK